MSSNLAQTVSIFDVQSVIGGTRIFGREFPKDLSFVNKALLELKKFHLNVWIIVTDSNSKPHIEAALENMPYNAIVVVVPSMLDFDVPINALYSGALEINSDLVKRRLPEKSLFVVSFDVNGLNYSEDLEEAHNFMMAHPTVELVGWSVDNVNGNPHAKDLAHKMVWHTAWMASPKFIQFVAENPVHKIVNNGEIGQIKMDLPTGGTVNLDIGGLEEGTILGQAIASGNFFLPFVAVLPKVVWRGANIATKKGGEDEKYLRKTQVMEVYVKIVEAFLHIPKELFDQSITFASKIDERMVLPETVYKATIRVSRSELDMAHPFETLGRWLRQHSKDRAFRPEDLHIEGDYITIMLGGDFEEKLTISTNF